MYTADMMTRIWQRPHSPSVDIGRVVPAIHLQYMPLSHVYGLEWLIATLSSGGIGYFAAKSDMSTLFDDIGLVRPTALNLVPGCATCSFAATARSSTNGPATASPPNSATRR